MTATLKNKNYKRSQKGRSMVEMLGVLAIVGVLSVGGVYGYGVAMKKHKANELLHQASMLATTISAQAMTNDGNLPQTITDFGNSGYDTELTDNGTKFILTMKDVDSAVCNQLKIGGMVQGVDCKEGTSEGKVNAEITYYKNLATNEAEGEKSPTGGGTDPCDKCAEGQQCIGGHCAEVSGECSNNSDCDKWCETNGKGVACYCAIDANYLDNDSACFNNFTGRCAVATTKSGIKGGYVVSSADTTWWNAVNFCKAHDKSLVSLADLGITGGYQDDAFCNGSDCTGTVNWADLRNKIGETDVWYWVTDAVSCDLDTWECTSGTNNNSCYVFWLNLSYDTVGSSNRYGNLATYALCE